MWNILGINGVENSKVKRIVVPKIPKRGNSMVKEFKYLYTPQTEGQSIYVRNLESSSFDILFGIGPAGTGKTLFACQNAIQMLYYKQIEKIVLTRPIVSVDEDLGFLPGDIQQKMDPWTKPIMDVFHEYYSTVEVKKMMENNTIDICPLAYMRGRTFTPLKI